MPEKNQKFNIKDNLADLISDDYLDGGEKIFDTSYDIIKKPSRNLKRIIITRVAYTKMIIIAQEVSKLLNQSMEVYALCIGDKGIIEDILIPPQKVSSISIHINAEDLLSLSPYIRENNLNIIGWAHSHGNMSVFFSSTDDNNQITVLNDTSNYTEIENIRVKYCFGITVNLKEELFGIVTTQYPTGEIAHEKAIFEIYCDLPGDWDDDEIRQNISKELKEKIKKKFFSYSNENIDDSNNSSSNIKTLDKYQEKFSLTQDDRFIIDTFLKKKNISNPKTKKLLINFVKFSKAFKKWKKGKEWEADEGVNFK